MSYATIYESSQDPDLRNRVAVCVNGRTPAGAEAWLYAHMLDIVSQPPIAEAWEYSVTANPWHGRRGYDPTVISDEMIQNAVSAVLGDEKEE